MQSVRVCAGFSKPIIPGIHNTIIMTVYVRQDGAVHKCGDWRTDGPDGQAYWEAVCGARCMDDGRDHGPDASDFERNPCKACRAG